MYKIIGYQDLRPIDWVSGKRMPLSPGEGHICDRCGAEHAVVYTVLDTNTNKQYDVGSGCATQQFGFEISKQDEAKKLVKSEKMRAEQVIDDARQEAVVLATENIFQALKTLTVPKPSADTTRYPGRVAWRIGDGIAIAASGRGDTETKQVALQDFYDRRIQEMVPPEWTKIYLRLYPEGRSKDEIAMTRKVTMLVLGKLRQKISDSFA